MTVIVAVAALLPRSHLADGTDPKPPITNEKVRDAVRTLGVALERKIDALQADVDELEAGVNELKTVAAKRGVAVIRAIPTTARSGDFLSHPRLFILGSTIKDFHDTLAWGAELSSAGPLPAGTYLIELRQPRPPDDDAACAGRKPLPASTSLGGVKGSSESNRRCLPMRLSELGGPTHRRLFSGSAVVEVDGTGNLSFTFLLPTAWVTTDRPLHTYAGSIMITKLE